MKKEEKAGKQGSRTAKKQRKQGKKGKQGKQGKQGNREVPRKVERVGDSLVDPLKRTEFMNKSAGENFLQTRAAER